MGICINGYMPCVAATNGTLSIMLDNKPNVNTAQFWFGIIADNCCAKVVSHPTLSNAPMLNKMQKKNKTSNNYRNHSIKYVEPKYKQE